MDFSLTEEELMIYNTASEFGENEVKSSVRERDDNEVWADELWNKMGALGFLGLPYEEQYGGGNANAFKTVLAMEGFGYGAEDAGLALAWGAHTILCGIPIFKLGTEAQKQKYLPKMASGKWIGGFSLTEPGSGSDAAGMKTTAIKKDGYYLLNGSKTFITNAPIGHHFVVTAITNPGHKAFGISTFIVEKNFKGFSIGKNMNKMGMRTSTTSEVFFDNCEVPEENLLGQENLGFVQTVKHILGWERCCLLAPAVGGLKKIGEK